MCKQTTRKITRVIISAVLVASMLLPNTNFVGMEANAAEADERPIWDFFKEKGYTNAGIAGIMGNLYMESGYKPYRLGNTSVTYAGYSDQGQTFTSQVDNFEISRAEFLASAKYTMYPSSWQELDPSTLTNSKYQYGYGLPMWYHYSVKATFYDYWKRHYWTKVEQLDEAGNTVMVDKATKSIGDVEVQINYLHEDMLVGKTNIIDKRVYNLASELRRTGDPFYACYLFHDCYEKSARTNFYKRINESIRVYNYYSDANDIIKVTTSAATDVTDSSAQISAKYANAGAKGITKFGVKYGTDSGSMYSEQTFDFSSSNTSGTVTAQTITGLSPATTYYFCPVVYVGSQPYYGTVTSFKTAAAPETPAPETPAPEAPAPETPAPETPAPETPAAGTDFILSTIDAKNITETSVDVCANYQNPGKLKVTQTGYEIGTSASNLSAAPGSPYSANITKASGILSTRTISGLSKGTTYYYRPYAVSGSNKYYGEVKSFTTKGAGAVAPENPPAPSGDPATITGATYPVELTEGSSFTLKGDISSKTNITKVEVDIINANNEKYISKIDTPNAKTYSIKKGMDPYISFGYIPAGNYKYVILATNGAGEATLLSKDFVINKKATPQNGKATASLSESSATYDGKAKNPTVIVKDSNGVEIDSSNYSVSTPSGRTNVGSYKYKVTFKGNYKGSQTLTFKINPKGTKISSVTGGKKKFTVKWTKQSALMKTSRITGYQIQYSRTSNFASNNGTKTVSGYSKTSASVTNLSAKKYYVRIRTYKTVSGVKYYSPWSESKAVSIK